MDATLQETREKFIELVDSSSLRVDQIISVNRMRCQNF